MSYLSSRTPRERGLIYLTAMLVALFAVWQFALNPLIKTKASALTAESAAERDLNIVQNAAARLSLANNVNKSAFDRGVIIESARRQAISISRVQPQSGGAFKVWYENVRTPQLYNMFDSLSKNYKMRISRAQINRREDGFIDAQITMTPS